jgi:GNAT superfamily N-acetyltransferase
MAIDVRPATTGDLAAVRTLLGHLHDRPGDVAWSSATWNRILGDPNRTILVAEDRGEFAVGTADVLVVPNLTHDGAPWALVENVVVDPGWRRRGVGRALIKRAVRVADDAGCHKLQLTSSNHRDGAHRFYERLGFTATSTGFRWSFGDRERAGAA